MPATGDGSQTKVGPKKVPSGMAARGLNLFVNNCAACHGPSGLGGDGPNLHGLTLSNAKITSTVNNGISGSMPAFKAKLKAQDIRAIIAYLRTLKK